MPSLACRVRSYKCFQQTGALSAGRFSEKPIPFCKRCLQFTTPDLQVAERGFDSGELVTRQRTYAVAWRATAIAFRKDCGQLAHREANGEGTPNQANASECLRGKLPVSRRGARCRGKEAETLVVAQRVRANSRKSRQLC